METDAGCKAQTRAPWTAGRCPVPHVGARHGVRISFACPSPFPHLSEPQRYMLRMKGLMDDGGQAGGKLAQIDLVTQPLAESGECAGRIVSTSIEPSIDNLLDASAQGAKQRHNCQGGQGNGNRGAVVSEQPKE